MTVVTADVTQIQSILITTNHILDYQQILDILGHICVRNPINVTLL